jgi:hypothetical protein
LLVPPRPKIISVRSKLARGGLLMLSLIALMKFAILFICLRFEEVPLFFKATFQKSKAGLERFLQTENQK